jgi:predicted TIM-barrel fold metal-dependent hydrolase
VQPQFPPNFEPDEHLRNLPLRAFRPRPALRRPEHVVPRAALPAVDAHNHLGRWLVADGWAAPDVEELLETMAATNVSGVVNLDGRWGKELEANLDRYDRPHPGRFATFCHVDWREATAAPGFGERLAASLRESVDVGARGLKVWKDLGLYVRDHDGALLMPDDDRIAPVWRTAAELGVPVLIHVADPIAFFEPVDATNERLEELLEHPDWWYGDRSRFPSFDVVMAAFERLVRANPDTTFIGAHAGCAADDLGWLERMLETTSNLHADIAARIPELGRRPRTTRRLMLRFPDRFLFGTDVFPPDAATYATAFRFLETADEHFPYETDGSQPEGRWAIEGLDLPDEVLRAVYSGNARRLIPGLSP